MGTCGFYADPWYGAGELMEMDMRRDTRSYGERLEEIFREMARDEARKVMDGGIPDCAAPEAMWHPADEDVITMMSIPFNQD